MTPGAVRKGRAPERRQPAGARARGRTSRGPPRRSRRARPHRPRAGPRDGTAGGARDRSPYRNGRSVHASAWRGRRGGSGSRRPGNGRSRGQPPDDESESLGNLMPAEVGVKESAGMRPESTRFPFGVLSWRLSLRGSLMKVYETPDIRNIALIGHGDCGKTSLASAMLFVGGAVNRLGRVDDGTATTDFDDEEI